MNGVAEAAVDRRGSPKVPHERRRPQRRARRRATCSGRRAGRRIWGACQLAAKERQGAAPQRGAVRAWLVRVSAKAAFGH